jgi:hypothetical protein
MAADRAQAHSRAGTGLIGQGFDINSYHRRRPDRLDPHAAFIVTDLPNEGIHESAPRVSGVSDSVTIIPIIRRWPSPHFSFDRRDQRP